jgi:hypothetical protein
MGRSTLWSIGFLFGVMIILVMALTLSPLAGLAVAVISLAFVGWRGGTAGLAGLFTGFGGFWMLIILLELLYSNDLDNSAVFWLFVAGIVPLVAGWILRSKISPQAPVETAPAGSPAPELITPSEPAPFEPPASEA